jgi:hypothetical protein
MEEAERQKGAELRRRSMVITRCSLEDPDMGPHPTFGAEAISLTARLSLEAWLKSGRELPHVIPSEMPIRFVSLGSKND